MRYSLAASLLVGSAACAPYPPLPIHLETRSEIDSRVTNVHVTFNEPVDGELTYTYGRHCTGTHQARDAHHVVARSSDSKASRLVWLMPKDAESGGCLSAWNSEGVLVGRSEPQRFQTVKKRDLRKRSGGANSVAMTQEMGIDTWGPWFDGVKLLENKALSTVDAEAAKSKEVAIVGGGMAGLMTYLVLSQSGMSNIKILEASQRLGGRVHTEYLSGGPFDYSYQEMGPMRFPKTVSVANETYNITDHELVFQLADEMNRLNNHDRNLSVDFIPWYQASANGLSYNNGFKLDTGLPPTLAQIKQNSSLAAPTPVLDAATQGLQDAITKITSNETMMIEIATNMHKAHKDFIVNGLGGKGGEVWSEFAYMVNYLNATLNQTDMVVGSSADTSFWNSLYDNVYFSATTWSTIDGGLSRLPLSFHPLVDNITTMDAHVDKVEYLDEENRVRLSWKQNYKESTYQNATFDYAVIAMPFSKVKLWRLPMLPTSITNAINNVPMASACKVALEYKTRFWEHLPSGPIYGSCSTTTDIPGVGSVCYPSYNMNGTGPASIMASYASGDWAIRWLSKTEEEHVQYMVDAMVEIHGEVAREQYTGNYNRRCWYLDPYEGGAWAAPTIGQHQLYIPEYFKTYSNMIFVGEQTSYTHAWIASALESGVRGAVQLLLELGLVDEAKAAVDKWMARWIEVSFSLENESDTVSYHEALE